MPKLDCDALNPAAASAASPRLPQPAPAHAAQTASPPAGPLPSGVSRRGFVAGGAAMTALVLAAPRRLRSLPTASQQLTVYLDGPIGTVRPEFHGQFAEHLGSCVYGGLWVGKNSPIPNVEGYREAAIRYLSALSIPVLRWPGGCYADDYHWRTGIGPQAARPHTVNIWWGNYTEDNSFGTHEFIGLCRQIGAEPYLAGNVGSGSPEELRDWLEYCNYPSGSALAEERAKNGAPEPFRVRYWGIGNESWGCGGDMHPEEYATLYRRYANFMHELGGVKLCLIASGPNGNDARWTHGLMDGLGWVRPGGLSMHYYSGGDKAPTQYDAAAMDHQLASFARIEEAVIQQRAILDGYPHGGEVGLILDEWGVWDRGVPQIEKRYGRLWQQSTMRSALAAGLGLNIFNRQADKLLMCNIAQMVNVLQSLLLTDGPDGARCVRTTTYYAFQLFKPHRGNTAVRLTGAETTPLGLSASASYRGQQLVISLVNPDATQPLRVNCAVVGGTPSEATAQILHDGDLNAANTFDAPDRIVPQAHPVSVGRAGVQLDLPPLSVATVTVRLS